jgi:hypothetical protein
MPRITVIGSLSVPAVLLGSLVGTVLTVVPATAATPAAGTASTTRLTLGDSAVVGDLVLAGGKLWLSHDNQVDVLSTSGKAITTISGLLGVRGLAASADGHTVYAALSQDSRVARIATDTATVAGSWTTRACPTGLAIGANRLFYSFGCDTGSSPVQGSFGSLSLADGSDGPAAIGYFAEPLIAAGEDTVATADTSMPSALKTYSVAADGTLTALGSGSTGRAADLVVSPDGADLLLTGYGSGYRLERYTASSMAPHGSFGTGPYPAAVAFSADGRQLAGGLSSAAGGSGLQVFDASTGSLTARSTASAAGSDIDVVPGTLQFAPDGAKLYALGRVWTGQGGYDYYLLGASTAAAAASSVGLTLTSPKVYGGGLTAVVRAPGRSGAVVGLTVTSDGSTRTMAATLTGVGVATVRIPVTANGTVTATLAGDDTHTAATASRAFTVPGRVSAAPVGYASTSAGVRHYRTTGAVQIDVQFLPRRTTTGVVFRLQRLSGKSWLTVQTDTVAIAADGTGHLSGFSGARKVRYRIVVSFAGDTGNTAAPTATSAPFVVG